MSTLCQGNRSMLTLCQGYVKGGGPCRRWLPLFDVQNIFYNLLIKSESMSTLCQGRYCPCRHYVKGVGPC